MGRPALVDSTGQAPSAAGAQLSSAQRLCPGPTLPHLLPLCLEETGVGNLSLSAMSHVWGVGRGDDCTPRSCPQ